MTTAGRFITFEGGEGAGKSTQVARLAEALRARGIAVVTTREPGGSPGAEQIRRLLVEGDIGRWDPLTEVLLHFAARREHLVRTVWPALARGDWVISDRFADSTLAYQGYGHGVAVPVIHDLYRATVGGFAPDLTLILDLPVATGLARAGHRAAAASLAEDRYERMGPDFHERLRQGFLAIAEANPHRCEVLPADGDVDQVAALVLKTVEQRLHLPSE